MCYNCTAKAPYDNSKERCMMNTSYTPENCTGAPNCTTVMISIDNEIKAYSAGCVVSTKKCVMNCCATFKSIFSAPSIH